MSPQQSVRQLLRLINIMTFLRGPAGCPWDRSQTHLSLRPYLLEEAHEVLEALDHGNPEALCEELGDLLLQIVFHAQISSELGRFGLGDVAAGISDKLIRRHPQIFAALDTAQSFEDHTSWERIKQVEKRSGGDENSAFPAGIPATLPALLRVQKTWGRRLRAHPATDTPPQKTLFETLHQLQEQLAQAVNDRSGLEQAFGELLGHLALMAEICGIDCESALRDWLHDVTASLANGQPGSHLP